MAMAETAEQRVLPRTLAGATVLQIVPALNDSPQVRTTISAAHALIQVGARIIIAGEYGDLVDQLKSFGGEWLPFESATMNPTKRRANAELLTKFIDTERVAIVHAKSASATWSAAVAAQRNGVRLITELPDLPRRRMWLATFYLGALSRGDRIISHSVFNARPMMKRYGIPPERISVIPRSLDLRHFNPANVPPERVTKLRQIWGIPHGARIVLVPGRIAPPNGHLVLAHAARILAKGGMRNVTFVLVGDDQRYRRFVGKFWKVAQAEGVDALFRVVGFHEDMPATYAAADFVAVPYTSAPIYGRVVAEAQAMAKPVIASSIGPLPENMITPPRMPEELSTGWEAKPGDPVDLAKAIETALALEPDDYRAHSARSRQFAEYTFSPNRAAAATLEIYASLLESLD
ncbi:glycosyl transferase group 1 [Rhodoplanes sp. Z2-YC6860]|nr:glycosyl transferase group 1 [Rhodoplanes sp. Z2-YC6860]